MDNKIFIGSLLTKEYFIICSYRANALHEYFVLIQFISINIWLTKYESHRQAKHRGAMYRKSDSDDAKAIALATLNMLDKLPDACPNDAYWSLGQLVHRRDNIMKQRTRLVNQLHEQLCIAYPSYKQFFNDISRPTALYFWEHYPSRKYLRKR